MRLIDYFDASAQRYPSKTAFIQPDGARLTYAEVEQQSRTIASALHGSGVIETGKAAVYSPNDARVSSRCLRSSDRDGSGCHSTRAIRWKIIPPSLNYTDVECLFYHSYFENEVRQLRASAPQLKQCICLDRGGGLGPSLPEFSSAAASFCPDIPDDPHRPCNILCDGRHDRSLEGRSVDQSDLGDLDCKFLDFCRCDRPLSRPSLRRANDARRGGPGLDVDA